MGTYKVLDTGEMGHYQMLDNGLNLTEIKKAHMISNIEMLLKGFIQVKKEVFREGEDIETINMGKLDKYHKEYKKILPEQGVVFEYTTSDIHYKHIFSGKKIKKIFIEKTPVIVAWSAPKKTELVKIINEKV